MKVYRWGYIVYHIYIYMYIRKYANFYKFFLLTVKIDWNLFLNDNTLKKLICTKVYSHKIALLLIFIFIGIVLSKLQMETVHTFLKRRFLGVCKVVAYKFRLLLEFCWVSSGGQNVVQNLLLRGGLWLNYCCSWVVTVWLWLVVGGGGEIMVGYGCFWVVVGSGSEIMVCWGWLSVWGWNYGWSWVEAVKLWLVVGGGSELMPGPRWLWVVEGGGGKNIAGRGWSWMVVAGCGWSHDLVMPI